MNKFEIERIRQSFMMPANHFHDFYEVYYLLSGTRYYFIKDRTYVINKGDLVFINKYELHKTGERERADHERILLQFNDDLLTSIGTDGMGTLLSPFHRNQHQLSLKLNEQTFVENLLFSIIHEQEQQPADWELYSQTLITQLLLYCGRLSKEKPVETSELNHPLHQKMTEIATYMNHHYKSNLTLATISETFFISPGYFSRSFKKITGFSFVEYLNNVRIREAQLLLRETNTKIIDVAEQSGFESIAHFGRVFKQLTKQSPNDYRKVMRMR